MKTLDAKDLQVGTRVITQDERRTGTVKAIDIRLNTIAVLLDGNTRITPECAPSEFKILTTPGLRLTGRPPPNTVPHSPFKGK